MGIQSLFNSMLPKWIQRQYKLFWIFVNYSNSYSHIEGLTLTDMVSLTIHLSDPENYGHKPKRVLNVRILTYPRVKGLKLDQTFVRDDTINLRSAEDYLLDININRFYIIFVMYLQCFFLDCMSYNGWLEIARMIFFNV